MTTFTGKRGSATLLVLIILSVLLTLTGALFSNISRNYLLSVKSWEEAKAFHIAEGGLHKALWELSSTGADYEGEKETALGEGAFSVQVFPLEGYPQKRIIESAGHTFHLRSPRVTLKAVAHLEPGEEGKQKVTLGHWQFVE